MKILRLAFLSLYGCATLNASLPMEKSLNERLNSMPTEAPEGIDGLEISWTKDAIPYIKAKSDQSLAFGVGLVHAHLRWGQIELYRHLINGRLSQSVGLFASDLDKALRVINLPAASDEIIENLPAETKLYLESYVAGLNHYIEAQNELPQEMRVLKIKKSKWTLKDVVSLSRLFAVDVSWFQMFGYLLADDKEENLKAFEKVKDFVLKTRSGSNSWVLGKTKSKSGSVIVANDPHLGFTVPNLWMIMAIKSPSYKALGFSLPGLPIVAVGRNEHLSWGGTNMRSQSTDFVELGEEDIKSIETKTTKIEKRWWWDETFEYRVSRHGPLLNDIPMFKDKLDKPVAFKWRGHQPSDEITAFFKAMKAKSTKDFLKAFKTYAVSGQNFLVGDKKGNIGMVHAVEVPQRSWDDPFPIKSSVAVDQSWSKLVDHRKIPKTLNPPKDYIVSANNAPSFDEPVLGFVFSPPQRKKRITSWIEASKKIGVDEVKSFHLDDYSQAAVDLRDKFLKETWVKDQSLAMELKKWNGHFDKDSRGALAHHLFYAYLAKELIDPSLQRTGYLPVMMLDMVFDEVAQKAASKAEKKTLKKLKKYRVWGDFHRFKVAHPISNAPLIGSKYVFDEFPISGGSETVFKTDLGLETEEHFARYGAQARHISDMSGPDKNYFVLLGGNDGWINSENFLDQVEMWKKGELLQLPLSSQSAQIIKVNKY